MSETVSVREAFVKSEYVYKEAVSSLKMLEGMGYYVTSFTEYRDYAGSKNGFVLMLNAEKMTYAVLFMNGWVAYGVGGRGINEPILNFMETISGS